jgi:MoxR-like ATPase
MGAQSMVFAREGFNVIATANTRDRGVNEMSAALKRRFNFETVFPIPDYDTEFELVQSESRRLLEDSGVPVAPRADVLELLVTTFRELRSGVTKEGQAIVGVRGYYLRGHAGTPEDVVECLAGTAAKDNADDLKRIRRYLEQRAKGKKGEHWRAFYDARHLLPRD